MYAEKLGGCNYKTVVVTNKNSHDGVLVVNTPEDSTWMEREIAGLEIIDTEYVLTLPEDSLIMEEVDEREIESILDDMDELQLNYCKFTAPANTGNIGSSGLLSKVYKTTPYSRNLGIGIYRKEYLWKVIGDGSKSPWELESLWLKVSQTAKRQFYDDIVIVNKDILHAQNSVLKGRWYYSAVQRLAEQGIEVKPSRDVISENEERKIKVAAKIGVIIPPWMRPIVKKIGRMLGLKFATEN